MKLLIGELYKFKEEKKKDINTAMLTLKYEGGRTDYTIGLDRFNVDVDAYFLYLGPKKIPFLSKRKTEAEYELEKKHVLSLKSAEYLENWLEAMSRLEEWKKDLNKVPETHQMTREQFLYKGQIVYLASSEDYKKYQLYQPKDLLEEVIDE